mmetsp:Transcript_4611/g.11985  ORF Transcript_4611/g.11985 Transcript_4611/m.11985 type:complete len:218 (-) Transcript_4611:246-899(-)
MSASVSRTLPSVTSPAHPFCASRRNLMSPPTLSHGPPLDMTIASFGPAISNASYSGLFSPPGLSCWMSGRCMTNLHVTARPAIFCPGARGLAPSMNESGHPMTHRPSMRLCVLSVLSLASRSSEMAPADAAAGPVANARRAMLLYAAVGAAADADDAMTRVASMDATDLNIVVDDIAYRTVVLRRGKKGCRKLVQPREALRRSAEAASLSLSGGELP